MKVYVVADVDYEIYSIQAILTDKNAAEDLATKLQKENPHYFIEINEYELDSIGEV